MTTSGRREKEGALIWMGLEVGHVVQMESLLWMDPPEGRVPADAFPWVDLLPWMGHSTVYSDVVPRRRFGWVNLCGSPPPPPPPPPTKERSAILCALEHASTQLL